MLPRLVLLSLAAILTSAKLSAAQSQAYYGKYIGKLKTLHHSVTGEVFAVDARTLHIRDFTYDGEGPAAYFYAGNSKYPSASGFRINDEKGTPKPLQRYRKKHVTITLPEGKTLHNIKWFSVWCDEFSVNFGDVKIPKNLDFPKPQNIDALNGVHLVSSEPIVVVDAQTLLIRSFSYDGEAPDAKFWVGQGSKPSPQGVRVPDENGKEVPLRRYDRKNIVLTLPGELTVFDIGHFGVWCEAFAVDFGHVRIPRGLNVPPSLRMLGVAPQTKLNCEVLWDDLAFEVRWAVAGESVVLQLVSKLEDREYMAFGLSGDDTRSKMVGGDVAVAWVDKATKGFAVDYFLESKAQCSGRRGSCPDERFRENTNDVTLLNAAMVNGYSIVTYLRPLKAQDEFDRSILTNGSQPIIWAIGPLNSLNETSYHSLANKRDVFLDFGRAPKWNCPIPDSDSSTAAAESPSRPVPSQYPPDEITTLAPPKRRQQATPAPVPKVQPWDIPAIQCYEPEDGVFYAQMGPTGGKRGYSAITGHVGWGISWYINGLLIPEINVVRGKTYTFVVEGGVDPEVTAKYHPFYITDDAIGGYLHKTAEEKAEIRIFAGARQNRRGEVYPTGTGRLCNWTPDPDQPPADEFVSFGAYQRTLTLECDQGEPGVVQWTPDKNTPDTVYYQCFTHRYLGWKINVHDSCDAVPAGSDPVPVRVPVEEEDLEEGEDDEEGELQGRPSIRVSTRVKPNGVFLSGKEEFSKQTDQKYIPLSEFPQLPFNTHQNFQQQFPFSYEPVTNKPNAQDEGTIRDAFVPPPAFQKEPIMMQFDTHGGILYAGQNTSNEKPMAEAQIQDVSYYPQVNPTKDGQALEPPPVTLVDPQNKQQGGIHMQSEQLAATQEVNAHGINLQPEQLANVATQQVNVVGPNIQSSQLTSSGLNIASIQQQMNPEMFNISPAQLNPTVLSIAPIQQVNPGVFTVQQMQQFNPPVLNIPSNQQLTPSLQIPSNQQLTPSLQIPSNQQLTPSLQISSNQQLTPSLQISSNQQLTPSLQISSNQQLTPSLQISSNQQLIPSLQQINAGSFLDQSGGINIIATPQQQTVDPNRKPVIHATTPQSVVSFLPEDETPLPEVDEEEEVETSASSDANITSLNIPGPGETKMKIPFIPLKAGGITPGKINFHTTLLPHGYGRIPLHPQMVFQRPLQPYSIPPPFRRPVPHRGFPRPQAVMHRPQFMNSAASSQHNYIIKKPFYRPPPPRPMTIAPQFHHRPMGKTRMPLQQTAASVKNYHYTLPPTQPLKLRKISTSTSTTTTPIPPSPTPPPKKTPPTRVIKVTAKPEATTIIKPSPPILPSDVIVLNGQNPIAIPVAVNTGFNPQSVVVEGGFKPIISSNTVVVPKTAQDRSSLVNEAEDAVDEKEVNKQLEENIDNKEDAILAEVASEVVAAIEEEEEEKNENPFQGQEPETFEPMFIPSPPDRNAGRNNSNVKFVKKPLLAGELMPPIVHLNHRNSPQANRKNGHPFMMIRPRPGLVRRPLFPNNIVPPFRIPARGGSPSFRYQQSEELIEDETPMAAERMDSYYLPPSDTPVPPGVVVTYDGKSVADAALASSISRPVPVGIKNTRVPVGGTADFIRGTPQFGPYRGEIPPPVPDVIRPENIPQLRNNQQQAQSLPEQFKQQNDAFPDPPPIRSTHLAFVQHGQSDELNSESSEIKEVIVPSKVGKIKKQVVKKTANSKEEGEIMSTVDDRWPFSTNRDTEQTSELSTNPTVELVGTTFEQDTELPSTRKSIERRERRSPHHEPGHVGHDHDGHNHQHTGHDHSGHNHTDHDHSAHNYDDIRAASTSVLFSTTMLLLSICITTYL